MPFTFDTNSPQPMRQRDNSFLPMQVPTNTPPFVPTPTNDYDEDEPATGGGFIDPAQLDDCGCGGTDDCGCEAAESDLIVVSRAELDRYVAIPKGWYWYIVFILFLSLLMALVVLRRQFQYL